LSFIGESRTDPALSVHRANPTYGLGFFRVFSF
jgi:hypothetical protein